MKRLYLLLVAGLLVIGSLTIACSDSKDDDGDNEPTAVSGETPSEGETPSDGGDGDGGQSELEDLASDFTNRETKATYNLTATSSAIETTGTITLFWRPPDSWRLDMTFEGSPAITMISTGGTTYTCQGDGTTGNCLSSPVASAPFPFLNFMTDPGAFATQVSSTVAGGNVDTSSETIAGLDGTCYNYSVQGASGGYCFSDDGALLRVSSSAAGNDFTIEATEVEGSVTDADFELPYEVITVPGQ